MEWLRYWSHKSKPMTVAEYELVGHQCLMRGSETSMNGQREAISLDLPLLFVIISRLLGGERRV